MCLLTWLASGSRSPGSQPGKARSSAEPGAQGSGVRPGEAGDSDGGHRGALADRGTAALAPLRSIHAGKIFQLC